MEHSKIYSIVDELSEFSLAESSTTLWAVDQTYRIIPSATGISGADISADCEFTYTSDDETIASVDESRLVSPLNAGTAQINVTATDKRTGKSMSKVFTVTVRKITRVTITGVPASVVSGGSFTAYAHAYDDKGTDITAEVKAANGFSWSDTQLTVNVSGSSGSRTLALSATFHGVPVNTSATYNVMPGVGSVSFSNGSKMTYYLDSNSLNMQSTMYVTDTDGKRILSGLTFQTKSSDLTGNNGRWSNNTSPKYSDGWRPFFFTVYKVGTFKHTFYVIYNGSRREVTVTVESPQLTLTLAPDGRPESGNGTGNPIYTMKATVKQGDKTLSLSLANTYSGARSGFTWTYSSARFTLIQDLSSGSEANPNRRKLQPLASSGTGTVSVKVVVRNETRETSYSIN